MGDYVVSFDEIDAGRRAAVGGKGVRLGELSRIEGVDVPAGFCVTTHALARVMAQPSTIDGPLQRLSGLGLEDPDAIRVLSAEVRGVIEQLAIPEDVTDAIAGGLAGLDDHAPYAVRSSATDEDLPTASFAGQHDSYLNVVGVPAILCHVSRCWGSLFTERAVSYRQQNGLSHREAGMAVVVQRMVFPRVAGVLFTANPVTANRRVASVEASFGLGEALVSGRVNPDVYEVRDGEVVARTVARKQIAVQGSATGGTEEVAIAPERQDEPALTDAEVVRLSRLGRRIEAHFGHPQDIEWCLVHDSFQIVQSRPITTLFPIPAAGDDANHVYVSVGHQQMMTDAMKPLGLSVWQLTTRRPMREAGGRLFVDVTRELGSPVGRGYLKALATSDPLIGDALQNILDRGDFIPRVPADDSVAAPAGTQPGDPPASPPADPALVGELIARNRDSVAALTREIRGRHGTALLDFIRDDIRELQRLLFDPESVRVLMAGMGAASWLNEHLESWLGERNAADTLNQSVDHNVTSEMGLALLEVADAVRAHPAVVAFLEGVDDEAFLDELPELPGGREARDAIAAFLDSYGMRCVGEIDITRPRWSERPSTLLPAILGNVHHFEPGAGRRRFRQGRREAWAREHELLARLRDLPDGEEKAVQAKRRIDQLRAFSGYREYPKYGMVSRYSVYRRGLLEEAQRLVDAQVLTEVQDIFYLRFEELHAAVRTGRVDAELIRRRQDEFTFYEGLTPPRVLTSEGEAVAGSYRRDDAPAGALIGLPVSAGTVEGRARVILDISRADLEPGDILITAYTDPSWTPLFVAIDALVTEVGGLMTHGAVIAREYGLPAVVGVERATQLIPDGARIRVHGTDGYVEILV